jgi:hypothetical protein
MNYYRPLKASQQESVLGDGLKAPDWLKNTTLGAMWYESKDIIPTALYLLGYYKNRF